MKLMIAIIQNDYVKDIMYELMDNNIRATKLASTGGFLKTGNTTILMGIDNDKVDLVIDIIEDNCGEQKVEKDGTNVEVSGANLFIIDMDKHLRI